MASRKAPVIIYSVLPAAKVYSKGFQLKSNENDLAVGEEKKISHWKVFVKKEVSHTYTCV